MAVTAGTITGVHTLLVQIPVWYLLLRVGRARAVAAIETGASMRVWRKWETQALWERPAVFRLAGSNPATRIEALASVRLSVPGC